MAVGNVVQCIKACTEVLMWLGSEIHYQHLLKRIEHVTWYIVTWNKLMYIFKTNTNIKNNTYRNISNKMKRYKKG